MSASTWIAGVGAAYVTKIYLITTFSFLSCHIIARWTDPDLRSGISVRELYLHVKKKKSRREMNGQHSLKILGSEEKATNTTLKKRVMLLDVCALSSCALLQSTHYCFTLHPKTAKCQKYSTMLNSLKDIGVKLTQLIKSQVEDCLIIHNACLKTMGGRGGQKKRQQSWQQKKTAILAAGEARKAQF